MWDLLFENKLQNVIPEERFFRDEPMYKHTTFRVGGNARGYVLISDVRELEDVLNVCKESDVSTYVIGNGSNLLVSDEGYDGLIIELGRAMNDIRLEDGIIKASAGALLSTLASFALKNSLTGLEFAAGIPGTVGGAMVMNAGAYGGEMKDVVKEVLVYDPESGAVLSIESEKMDFSYRHSVVKDKGYIVLGAQFKLMPGVMSDIKAVMDELAAKRREKQPLEYPSAGSTFKRPEGYFAGKLIQDSGLMGYSVGDAEVSKKHAGFVINKGKAKAADIHRLIYDVRDKVLEDTGVTLEPEVIMLGKF